MGMAKSHVKTRIGRSELPLSVFVVWSTCEYFIIQCDTISIWDMFLTVAWIT